VCSALRATGLVPYNPDAVLTKLRETLVSDAPPTTPPHSATTLPPIPLTSLSLKQQGDDLQTLAANLNLLPEFQEQLGLVLRGGMVQALSGEQAVADLGQTKAAEKVRAARQKSRRIVQKGGVLYAHQARSMVKQKEEAELQKAEIALRRAQAAMAKAQSDQRKPLLKEAKDFRMKLRNLRHSRKRQMRVLCVEVRREGRRRRCV